MHLIFSNLLDHHNLLCFKGEHPNFLASTMTRVVRFPRHDDDASFVLVHVDNTRAGSSRPLDLTLVGTDNSAVYDLTRKLKFGVYFRS